MPQTRSDRTRREKEQEVLDAARRRLVQGGVEAVTVAGVARELGVAPNSVYWYFPSRDHLLVAMSEDMLENVMRKKPRRGLDRVGTILWFVDQMGDLNDVRLALKERARESTLVARFLEDFAALKRDMLRDALRTLVPDEELDLVADAFIAVVHDTGAGTVSPSRRRRIREFALNRLVGK